jgi:hypothetical protein
MALYLQVAITDCCTRLRSRQRRHERSRVQAGQIVRNRRIKGVACPITATARSASVLRVKTPRRKRKDARPVLRKRKG